MDDNIIRYTIHENVLTDDYIEKCKEGYHFKGHNNAKYRIIYYTYANEWSDKENVIYGQTIEAVLDKYGKATGRLDDEQVDYSEADEDGHYETTREMAEMIDYIEG